MQVSGQVHAPAAITRYPLASKLVVHQDRRGGTLGAGNVTPFLIIKHGFCVFPVDSLVNTRNMLSRRQVNIKFNRMSP
jgi:hypothetical protein